MKNKSLLRFISAAKLQPKVKLSLNSDQKQKGHSCNLLVEAGSLFIELTRKLFGTELGKHPDGKCGKSDKVKPV